MLGKSIIAGVVLAAAAGSGVYYGIPTESGEAAIRTPVKRTAPIAPKSVEVKNALAHPHKKSETKAKKIPAKDVSANEERKWIDQYLERKVREEDRTDKETVLLPDPVEVVENVEVEIIEDVEIETKALIRDKSDEEVVLKTKPKKEIRTRIIRERAPKQIETTDSFETINVILREAKAIQSLDLRDRAYLNVVDYALMHEYFGEAKNAMFLINQPELRETARSRIAVRFASTGNPDAAFDMVEAVEMEDFRDPMRIQIIEAIIAADADDHSHE